MHLTKSSLWSLIQCASVLYSGVSQKLQMDGVVMCWIGLILNLDLKTGETDFSFDLVVAGFPCQDLSSAHKSGKGLEGSRSGLFFDIWTITIMQAAPG